MRYHDAHLLERCYLPEIIDSDLPDEVMRDVHRDLTRTHRWLGNTAAILSALRRDPLPVRRVLDIGCGEGALLLEIRRRSRLSRGRNIKRCGPRVTG